MEHQKAVLYIKKNIAGNDMLKSSNETDRKMQQKGYYRLPVQYNPATLSLSNAGSIQEDEQGAGTKEGPGGRVSLNSESCLSFELIFEAAQEPDNKDYVKKNAEGIMSLMLDRDFSDVVFSYGKMNFQGELNNVDIKYTMFDNEGNPIWAVVSVSITEKKEEEQKGTASKKGPKGDKKQYQYDMLAQEYENFKSPVVVIKIGGKDISDNKNGLSVAEVEVDLTSGYEASAAVFSIYNSFDKDKAAFRMDEIKKYILLGTAVSISTGYSHKTRIVFRGFIARTGFVYEEGEIPHVEVTCMDIKGIMMSGSYAKQLSSASYGDAVKEIFEKSIYTSMQDKEIFTDLSISSTPDSKKSSSEGEEDDRSIEMVNESDFEFVVRAAKKFNYEFFIDCGAVIFRKAKSEDALLMDLKMGELLKNFEIEYDITGLVENIHVRGMDTGKMKLIKSKAKFNQKVSMGNKAKQLIKKSEKVCIDPTIKSKEDADYRGEYLLDDMSYRFGTLNCHCIGIPELKPGYFINVSGMGAPVDNRFYVTSVKHTINSEGIYVSEIMAKASSIQ